MHGDGAPDSPGLARENADWGYRRAVGELRKLRLKVA